MKRRTKIMHWLYKLSWKKIVAVNGLLLMIVVIPVSINMALNPTRTRSEAALLPKPQPVTKEFETPTGPPKIYLVDHFFGKPGDAVLIHGENLGGWHEDNWVALNGKKIETDNIVSWTGSYIEFKIPTEAESGQVEVNVSGQRVGWAGMFFVTNDQTETELRLINEGEINYLTGKGLVNSQKLLVWLLVMAGEGEVQVRAMPGVSVNQTSFLTPLGKVYEVRLSLVSGQLTDGSALKFVKLLKITKAEEIQIGIARGELENERGELRPLQVHPLYVSLK